MTKDLTVVEQEVSPLVTRAKALVIASAEDMKASAELLSQCNKYLDSVVSEKEKVTKPLNAALKAERLRFKPIEEVLETAISALRNEQSRYQTEMLKKQREEEAKIAARVKEGKGNLKLETAVKKIDELEKPEEIVNTDSGMVKFREQKKLKITDASLVPDTYWIIDEAALLEALKAGTLVAGAEIELVQVPVNFR